MSTVSYILYYLLYWKKCFKASDILRITSTTSNDSGKDQKSQSSVGQSCLVFERSLVQLVARRTVIQTEISRCFPQSFWANSGIVDYIKLCHEHILTYYFQFIIHNLPSFETIWPELLALSLNKPYKSKYHGKEIWAYFWQPIICRIYKSETMHHCRQF